MDRATRKAAVRQFVHRLRSCVACDGTHRRVYRKLAHPMEWERVLSEIPEDAKYEWGQVQPVIAIACPDCGMRGAIMELIELPEGIVGQEWEWSPNPDSRSPSFCLDRDRVREALGGEVTTAELNALELVYQRPALESPAIAAEAGMPLDAFLAFMERAEAAGLVKQWDENHRRAIDLSCRSLAPCPKCGKTRDVYARDLDPEAFDELLEMMKDEGVISEALLKVQRPNLIATCSEECGQVSTGIVQEDGVL